MLSKKRPSCLKLKTFFNFLKANFCKTKGRVWSHLLFRIQIQQIDLVPDGSATLDSTIPIKLKGNRIPYSQLASSPKKFTVWFLSLQQIHTRVETKNIFAKIYANLDRLIFITFLCNLNVRKNAKRNFVVPKWGIAAKLHLSAIHGKLGGDWQLYSAIWMECAKQLFYQIPGLLLYIGSLQKNPPCKRIKKSLMQNYLESQRP